METLNSKHIHHITSISGPAQESYDFYAQVLGLKLVKQTVNFDDISTYHLYFSNQNVDNGTILTIFPWEQGQVGTRGGGQGGRVAFAIPRGSSSYWFSRLDAFEVEAERDDAFQKDAIHFEDPFGLQYALVEVDAESEGNEIIGFHGMEILSAHPEDSRQGLIHDLGLEELEEDGSYYRFQTGGLQNHHILLPKEAFPRRQDGIGTVHHVAWSVPDTQNIEDVQAFLKDRGYRVTELQDRNYFKSVYTREKGRVLFEFATDSPGFLIDEPIDRLGQELKLPAHYEGQREDIEAALPSLNVSE